MDNLFKGRKVVIATKHHKEQVMTPLLEKELGLECGLVENLDTDLFGTFTGEVERLNDPLETARQKCRRAMELSACDMAIASEGSFGLHPTLLFVHADSEIVLLTDKKTNQEWVVREISTKTNFNGSEITSYEELKRFAASALFPSHGLILRKSKQSMEGIYKGLKTAKALRNAYQQLMKTHGTVYVETDMRALYNPTRMAVIETAMKKLIHKLKTQCPGCGAPGFSAIEAKPGLPCGNCGGPTRSTLLHVLRCQCCGFSEEKLHPHGKSFEDPMYCDVCNP